MLYVLVSLTLNCIILYGINIFSGSQEIKSEPNVMCERVDKTLTFKSSQVIFNHSNTYTMSRKTIFWSLCFTSLLQLEDGDIVCFQKFLSAEACQQLRCPDVPSFFEYRHNLQVLFIKYWWMLYRISFSIVHAWIYFVLYFTCDRLCMLMYQASSFFWFCCGILKIFWTEDSAFWPTTNLLAYFTCQML